MPLEYSIKIFKYYKTDIGFAPGARQEIATTIQLAENPRIISILFLHTLDLFYHSKNRLSTRT